MNVDSGKYSLLSNNANTCSGFICTGKQINNNILSCQTMLTPALTLFSLENKLIIICNFIWVGGN